MAQSQSDLEAVNNVIIAFQEDFNEGGFKNAHSYTTPDWVHINPGGGVTRGRKEVLEEVIAVHKSFLKGVSMTIRNMEIRFCYSNCGNSRCNSFNKPIRIANGRKTRK
jgi:ketosteroid isomerase-like protein